MAVVFAGYLSQTFVAVDASLRQLALHSERVGGPSAKESDWGPALVAARAALGTVGSISVVDSTGVIRHATLPVIVGQMRRDQYVFRRLAADTADELVADPPFRALTGDHAYMIPLGRRLPGAHGGFGGIIVATFRPISIRDVFRAADIGRAGQVAVFHRDGFVILREPSNDNPIGENAARQSVFEAAKTTDSNSVFRGRATANGPMLRTAYRFLPERDLIVAVSLSEDEVLREWRRDAAFSAISGSIVALVLGAIVLLIVREMDRRLEAEEAVTRSQRLESIGRLTGGIAHDFNNLLTVILGNVALIRDIETGTSTELGEASAQIERAASRGSALVRQLLAFARQRPLQSRTVDLASLIRDAKPMLDRVLGEDVAVELRAPEGQPILATVDPAGIESALLNLCINARDAMPEGGRIDVELSRATFTEADARRNPDTIPGAYVAISVTDTGTGIAEEHLPHLFEPFFTTKDIGRGTGLGLSMVYGFVKQSGGTVDVRSEHGRGTVVTLYLPESHDAVSPALVGDDLPPPRGNGETVLVVEDEPDLLTLASRLLTELGYRVITAPNGVSGLSVARRSPHIDLVVTDIVMPGGMSGRDLAKALESVRPGIPVIFVSGHAGPDSNGATDDDVAGQIIAKPYDRRSLAVAVYRALRSDN